MTRALAVFTYFALCAVAALPLGAQRAVVSGGRSAAVVRSNGARADSSAPATAAAVIVNTEPNSVRVVVIQIPPELHGRNARFTFVRQSQLNVQGRLEGAIAPDSAPGPIVLNVSVPSTAPAGRTTVGVMQFTCDDGCEAIEVPVYLDVQAHSALQVEPSRPLLGAHAGARVTTDIMVRNAGNATEQVTLTLTLPNDWRSRILVAMPLRLAAGATAVVPVEISVADDAGMGDYGVEIQVASPAGGSALAALTVRVGAGQKGAVGWRPLLMANVGVARDESGNVATAYGADLTGEVLPDISANGRASFVHDADPVSSIIQRSLGRLGYSSANSSYLILTGPQWTAGGGMLGLADDGIAGNGLWGEGLTGHATVDSWRGGVFDVDPGAGGHYFLGDASHMVGAGWAGLLFSDLRQDGAAARAAQTVAATFEVPTSDGTLLLQAGRRSSDTTDGLTWLAHFQRRTRDWSFNVLASHTPAGASAFAQAEDQYQLDGFRKLNNVLSGGASLWGSRDDASGNTQFTGSGWTVTPQISLARYGSIGLEMRSSSSTGKSGLGAFGDSDDEYKASWIGNLFGIQTTAGASRGTIGRNSSLSEDLNVNVKATSVSLFGSASLMTRAGAWQINVNDQRTGAGVGIPTQQLSVAAGVDQLPILPGRVSLRAQLVSYYLGATQSITMSQVVGIDIRLPGAYRLSIDAERNDLDLIPGGGSSWVLSTKIRRAIDLPALRSAVLRGVVYADMNGNGKRDRNEKGVAGAVVLVDGSPVTTDAQGRFAIDVGRTNDIEVDPRSLPMGWIAGPRPLVLASGTGDVELAVVPTSPVEITIHVASSEGLDTANVHLEKAVVVLTDSIGRKWSGTPNAKGVMRFDALPPGLYEVSADLSLVGETLVLPADLPMVRVEGAGEPLKVELSVAGRKIRLTPPGGARKISGGSGSQSPDHDH